MLGGITKMQGQSLHIHHWVLLLWLELPESVLPTVEYYSHSQLLIIHSEQMFMNSNWFLTFSNQEINQYALFLMDANLCHFRIKCGAANCLVKQLELLKNDWEYTETSLMSWLLNKKNLRRQIGGIYFCLPLIQHSSDPTKFVIRFFHST
jgi:hypothetical protein